MQIESRSVYTAVPDGALPHTVPGLSYCSSMSEAKMVATPHDGGGGDGGGGGLGGAGPAPSVGVGGAPVPRLRRRQLPAGRGHHGQHNYGTRLHKTFVRSWGALRMGRVCA